MQHCMKDKSMSFMQRCMKDKSMSLVMSDFHLVNFEAKVTIYVFLQV